MLTSRVFRNLARTSMTCHARISVPVFIAPVPRRMFAAKDDEESNFEGHSDFEPKAKAQGGAGSVNNQITEWITNNDVCLFMKGNRKMPRCGFSNYCVQIFKFYGVKEIKDVNVLEDEALREGIKTFSNWPTIPQIYVKGQFVGGCDIMKEMHADGSLEELLIREGIIKSEVANR